MASGLSLRTRRCVAAGIVGTEAQFWLNLQSRYDLLVAEAALKSRLDREVRARAA